MNDEACYFDGQFLAGTKLICVSSASKRFTTGKTYVVDKRLRLPDDHGEFIADGQRTVSRFVVVKDPDPIAHMFKVIPEKRKFVGGDAACVGITLEGGKIRVAPYFSVRYTNAADARLLAAALIAAADAADGNAC